MATQLTREMFEYLAALARLTTRPMLSIGQWKVEGVDRPVTLIGELPDHPSVKTALAHDTPPGVLVSITRPRLPEPPDPDPAWKQWAGARGIVYSPGTSEPLPRPSRSEAEWHLDRAAEEGANLYEAALERWRVAYRVAKETETVYSRLWEQRQVIATEPERWELVAAVGLLEWSPDGHRARRPLVTMAASLEFNGEAQRIDIHVDETALRVETDMLPAVNEPARGITRELMGRLDEVDTVFDSDQIGSTMTWFVGQLPHSGGRGRWDPAVLPSPNTGPDPLITFAPLVAVRPRPAHARAELLEALADAPELSEAMRALVEITAAQLARLPSGEEIAQRFHPELLLPEPSSPAQRQIALSMAQNPLTVVFGPPGTGKTYTIANLLGHLLASGKRVLVTAEKEEALHEVRGKVIEDLRDLVVPVLQGSARDKKLLAHAIGRIAQSRRERPLPARIEAVDRLEQEVAHLRGRHAEATNRLLEAWKAEAALTIDAPPYVGTIEQVAESLAADRADVQWLGDSIESPHLQLSEEDLVALGALGEADTMQSARHATDLPPSERLMSAASGRKNAGALDRLAHLENGLRFASTRRAAATAPSSTPEALRQLASAISGAAASLESLEAHFNTSPEWARELLADLKAGHDQDWLARADRTERDIEIIGKELPDAGSTVVTAPSGSDPAAIRAAALIVLDQVNPGRRLRRFLLPSQVKEAVEQLDGILVNGSPIDTREEAAVVEQWATATLAYRRIQHEWARQLPAITEMPMLQGTDRVRGLAATVRATIAEIEKVRAMLTPVFAAGVVLENRWSWDALRKDEVAVEWKARRVELDEQRGKLDAYRRSIPGTWFAADRARAALDSLIEHHDPEPWAVYTEDVETESRLRGRSRRALVALERLNAELPMFATVLQRAPTEHLARVPLLRQAVAWRYAVSVLERAGSRRALLDELDAIEHSLAAARRRLAGERAWLKINQRLTDEPALAQALRDYSAAQARVPKTRTAKSYLPNLRMAQQAMNRCAGAVPVWVMSIDQVAELFGEEAASGKPLFDVVIVDEASQSPITSAFIMQLAAAVAIVGDPYQTSPPSFQLFEAQTAARSRISDRQVRARLDPNESLWKVANIAIDRIDLTEHFRCPPEIIGWARERIYRDLGDMDLELLTGTDPARPKPIVTHHVMDGYGDRTNPNEAARLVEDLGGVLANRPAWLRDIGIVARTDLQAAHIQRLVFDRFDPTQLEALDLRVGTPYQFQGAQRDLMFLSMTDAPPTGGSLRARRGFDTITVNQMNVAVSRARRQLRVFYSCPPAGYADGDVRRSFLEYAIEEHRRWDLRTGPGVPPRVPEDRRVEPFDSVSEQRLFNALVDRGFAVLPQVTAPVGSGKYRLDMVVQGAHGQVAVEYDGPHHDEPDQYMYDREREQDLRRCGWTVIRVHHTEFGIDRRRAADELESALRREGVLPVGEWDGPAPPEAAPGSDEPEGPPLLRFDGTPDATVGPSGPVAEVEEEAPAATEAMPVIEEEQATDAEESARTEPRSAAPAVPVSRSAAGAGLAPYEAFSDRTRPPLTATKSELVDGILRIVDSEGPVLGDRIIDAYTKASGGQRAGHQIRHALNSAITSAVRRGLLLEDDPLHTQGNKYRTYRRPEQAPVVERELGPRSIHDVPPAELAARLRRVAERFPGGQQPGSDARERIFRAVLEEYGLVRLTTSTMDTLNGAWRLLESGQ